MVAENFKQSLSYVLANEGGNDDDPDDHGGRTSRGITQREYNSYCRLHHLPLGDVWRAPQPVINEIYHDGYWFPYCDGLPLAVDYQFFDMAVNAGPFRAVRLLQRALGVSDDGRIGPVTREAIAKADPRALTTMFAQKKRNWYRSIAHGSQRKYLRGWLNRANDVEANALKMLRDS